jgi:putative PEP-CTERM system TPR-repeat lipoprotein
MMEKRNFMQYSSKASAIKTALLNLLILGLTGLTMAACNKPQDAQTLIADARNYQQKGDNKAAIIQLKNSLQQNPNDPEARYLLGTIYNKTGDLQSAEKELGKALSLGMSPTKVWPELGQTMLGLGQFQQLLDNTQTLSGNDASAEIFTLRGTAFLALDKAQEAKKLFEQALEKHPHFPDAMVGMAKYSLMQQDVDTAIRLSDEAVEKNPSSADAWLFKGDLLRILGKTESALTAYNEVIKLKPNSAPAYLNKAFLEIGDGKFDSAKADVDAARKLMPGSLLVFYTQAMLDYSQGKYAAALESLQQVFRAAPDHMPSLLLGGAVQLALGSLPQAEQHLKQYLEKDPKNLYARKLLASVLLKNREGQRAVDILAPALKDKNIQPDSQLLALAGEAYMQTRDFEKATAFFERASSMAPENATLHAALSMSKMGQGDSARAISELEMARNLDPKSSQAGILLVMTHLRLKEFDKALAAAKAVEKEHPDNPLIQNLKGGIYLSKKDSASARASFEKALSLQPSYFPAVTNLAQLDMQENKPDAAKRRFEALLQNDKKNIQAMTALAGIALNRQENKEATMWLERAYKENPDLLEPALLLEAHYLRLGEKQKALSLVEKLRGTHPNNPDVLDFLAQAQFANNDKAGALESYNKLVAMLPGSPLAQFRIAAIHIAMDNLPAASEALRKALALKPDYLDAQLTQILLDSRNKNYGRAIAVSKQIQKQYPKLAAGYVAEGDLELKQNNPALASKAYEHALSLGKDPLLLMKLHASLSQTGKRSEANSRLVHWLKEHPGDTTVRMYLAEAYLTDRQAKPAIEQYQAVLQQHPENVAALNNLATALQQNKDPQALEYAEKANRLAADNPAVLDTLGSILIEQGNTARGLPLLRKAVSLAPDMPDIRYHLALGLIKVNDKASARKELEQLVGSSKNFADIGEARALLKEIQ